MDIIELLERRDEAGIELLKLHYSKYCYAIVYGHLRSHEETEEALNDVWLKIWNSIPPERPRRLRAYLAQVARNTALDYIKRNEAQKRCGMTVLLDEIAEVVPAEADSDGMLKDALNRFLRSLGKEEQRVFLRRYWYGATIEELANDFHSSQTRIANMLMRTRKKLKKFLEQEGYTV